MALRMGYSASKDVEKKPLIDMMSMMTTVGMMPGSVTCHVHWSLLAPSTLAASYSSGLMPAMADRYRMEFQPISFHRPETVNTPQNLDGSRMNGILSAPHAAIIWLTMPVCSSSIRYTRPATITHERKCGR